MSTVEGNSEIQSGSQPEAWVRFVPWALIVLLVARTLGVIFTPLDLGVDEAQYWRWSQTLDWGYYSKPPLIAWFIAATTAIFGDIEWAVRLAPPFLHTATAFVLLRLGTEMFNARTGALTGLVWATMPGVWVSSLIMSTDAVLLPFWALGLLMLWRLKTGGGYLTASLLGVAIGLGFLGKYAMSYFLLGVALAAVIDQLTRQALLSPRGLVVGGSFAAIFTPHMIWNASNGFKTVSHTADNANWGTDPWTIVSAIENVGKFYADQLGVFGPVTFLALFAGLVAFRSQFADIPGRSRWLLCFILPPLLIILFQAFVSRAHANWAATAYPAAAVLVSAIFSTRTHQSLTFWVAIALLTALGVALAPDIGLGLKLGIMVGLAAAIMFAGFLTTFKTHRTLTIGIGINLFVGVFMALLAVSPPSVADSLGFANAFKRLRGWDQTVDLVAMKANEIEATSIIVDEREVWHGLDYYGRNGRLPAPIKAWRRHGFPKNFAEEAQISEQHAENALIASYRPGFRERIKADFATIEEIGSASIDLGGGRTRNFVFFRASGYQPLERTREYEDAFDNRR